MRVLNIFVPGRLCLIGEHSDWAGLYKTINANIIPGQAIVTGTEQGIYASIKKAKKFIVSVELTSINESFECDMESELLRQTATSNVFFSYVAGVASYIKDHYNVKGLYIKITKMDLPIKSGLSSSAAICVLVTKAFNKLYRLGLNLNDEMFVAYSGEQRTLSRCGRLDQACAYGRKLVHMIFDGNEVFAKPVTLKKSMFFVISDLNGEKNTIRILADLNKCFPYAESPVSEKVQEALGIDNVKFIHKAINLIENGEIEQYGNLMIEYQKNFDEKVSPACPSQLTSPLLHNLFKDKIIIENSFGAKGVGSQGDGTIQILAKNKNCQEKIISYLRNEKKLNAFELTIKP